MNKKQKLLNLLENLPKFIDAGFIKGNFSIIDYETVVVDGKRYKYGTNGFSEIEEETNTRWYLMPIDIKARKYL